MLPRLNNFRQSVVHLRKPDYHSRSPTQVSIGGNYHDPAERRNPFVMIDSSDAEVAATWSLGGSERVGKEVLSMSPHSHPARRPPPPTPLPPGAPPPDL